jgi:hypothetical protein
MESTILKVVKCVSAESESKALAMIRKELREEDDSAVILDYIVLHFHSSSKCWTMLINFSTKKELPL